LEERKKQFEAYKQLLLAKREDLREVENEGLQTEEDPGKRSLEQRILERRKQLEEKKRTVIKDTAPQEEPSKTTSSDIFAMEQRREDRRAELDQRRRDLEQRKLQSQSSQQR
jgi:hypothetical protein